MTYEFGRFRLEPDERLLLKEGQPVTLPPKCFDVLLVLVRNAGHLIQKDELLREVWPETFVEENSLTRTISRLRSALGEGPTDASYVETVSKGGYRFKARVEERHQATPAQAAAYFAIVCADVASDATVWSKLSRESLLEALSSQRHTATTLADQYGSSYQMSNGTECIFLFTRTDVAVHFALALLDKWNKIESQLEPRVGVHFGECIPLENATTWIGTAIQIARNVIRVTPAQNLYVTEAVVDLLELSLFRLQSIGSQQLPGDHLQHRALYAVTAFERDILNNRPEENLTAEAWFLKAAAMRGTSEENSEAEAKCYRKALSLRPDYPEAHNNLGVLLKTQGQFNQAADHYNRALQIRPDYPEAHYNLAILLEADGRTSGAAHHYKEAFRFRPDYVDAHHRYANLMRAKGRLEEARVHFDRALELRPGAAEIHNNAAILMEDLGDMDRAEFHYKQALRLRQDYAEAHYNYALLLERSHRSQLAERHCREAIRLWPDYAEAHNNLAAVLYAREDFEGAELHYKKALQLRPRDPEVHYNYALLLKRIGRHDEAEVHRRTIQELMPDVKKFKSAIDTPH